LNSENKQDGVTVAGISSSGVLGDYWAALRRYLRPGPAHLLMYLAGRFQIVRTVAVTYFRYRCRRTRNIEEHWSRLKDVDVDQAVASLKQKGLYGGLCLRDETLNEFRLFCQEAICFGNGQHNYPFRISDRSAAEQSYQLKFSVGRYLTCLSECSTLKSLVHDSTLLSIARGYLGVEPAFIGARMWWSFCVGSNSDQQRRNGQSFHYDLDGYRAIAFFFYLSDVDLGTGPHVCALKSHRRKPLSFLFSAFKSRSDEQIETVYGPDQIVTVCGSAGYGFAEDIFCYHKGLHPVTSDRLLLQIRYGLRTYGGQEEEY
jgi:hypothetical protein